MTPEQKARELETRRAWRRANPDKVAAQKKRWRDKNPDKVAARERRRKAQKAEYYQNNKEQFAARSLKWRTENKERWNEIARNSIARNPQANADRSARRRARERGVPHEPVDRLAIYQRDRGICHLCNTHVDIDVFTLDHIIPISKKGPHTPDNLAVAHRSCNSRKRDRVELTSTL